MFGYSANKKKQKNNSRKYRIPNSVNVNLGCQNLRKIITLIIAVKMDDSLNFNGGKFVTNFPHKKNPTTVPRISDFSLNSH